MTKPMVRIYTSVYYFIDREMNAIEFAQYGKDKAEAETRKAEAEANALAKSALLAKLGITADEAKLLLA